MPQSDPTRPELLSPAGDWMALRAAVAHGADAVYFGLDDLNARHRATNFTLAELPAVVEYLHQRNVRGYVALNTLVFSDELPRAAELLAAVAEAGADAVIVQDLGLMRLAARLAPGLPVHASTQATQTEPRGIELLAGLGVRRVILARELSLDEIGQIAGRTTMPLEVFVHGALCVAYSGQCLTSEALGGRSANRGQCAQACRLPYELIVDGALRPLGRRAYLLSPQDLAAYDLVGPLAARGVCSFKIEGRLKSPQYVAVATATYRAALDAALAGRPFEPGHQDLLDLQQSFSRGFSPGFLAGPDHQRLVEGRFPKSRGVLVGRVAARQARWVRVERDDLQASVPLAAGDGVVFDEGHPEQDEQGGRIWQVRLLDPQTVEIAFAPGAINTAALAVGALVWKTDDPRLKRRVERALSDERAVLRVALDFHLAGELGGPLRLRAAAADGTAAEAAWAGPLEPALRHPLSLEVARGQLGRLGDTPFSLGEVTLSLPGPAMVPKSVLNALRRETVDRLCQARRKRGATAVDRSALDDLRRQARTPPPAPGPWPPANAAGRCAAAEPPAELPPRPVEMEQPTTPAITAAQLSVLVRNETQLGAVLAWHACPAVSTSGDDGSSSGAADALCQPGTDAAGRRRRVDLVICDFEDPRRYRAAVDAAREAGVPVALASLRICKPSDDGLLRQIARYRPDAVLVRNLGSLSYFRRQAPGLALLGDYSLNVANELAADWLLSQGLARLVPSYDLNWPQMQALLERSRPERFEIVVHQHLPMFHMEHCVFAATLSSGKDYRDCGRPCDRHRVELRDRTGAELPLVADVGCRNTVFHHLAQSAAEYLPAMQRLGAAWFRVELLRESAAEVADLLDVYQAVLAGRERAATAYRRLRARSQLGVTRGTLEILAT